jgi:hypothetical protein
VEDTSAAASSTAPVAVTHDRARDGERLDRREHRGGDDPGSDDPGDDRQQGWTPR